MKNTGAFHGVSLALVLALVLALSTSCKWGGGDGKQTVWIYTSLYKDTVDDVQKKLKEKFPEIEVQFFQAGSEEVAAKVSAEDLAGGTRADVLVFSDRFWFEEMAQKGKLLQFRPQRSELVPAGVKSADGFYSAVSYPVMVIVYNSDAIPEKDAPKTFKDLADPKFKGKITIGSPLASGTNFTTVAFLQKAYGWDYFKGLRANDVIAEGGNSAVQRRVETKERPVGWLLLENFLRLKETKMRVVFPEDGAILQSNVLAIVKKEASREPAQKIADWFFSEEGQAAMTRSFMYATVPGAAAPVGAKPQDELMKSVRPWSQELVKEMMTNREAIKEEFAKIVLQ